ncbi:MAG: hypothetical protein K2H37_01670 [Lachnospiraceae bacterium]|nr:hypothetical protein [Lachnospiraceae bacterium]
MSVDVCSGNAAGRCSLEVGTIEKCSYPMEEIMPIVSELAWKYTGCDHSSVTYEKAQMLMEAVMYCIREDGRQEGNALVAKNVSAREAYEHGREIVKDKLMKLQTLYNELIPNFRDYGSMCLKDTVRKGIPAFLERYDFRYAPQETLRMLDYPILRAYGDLSGVSLVLNYLQDICLEQKFLQKMDNGYPGKILRKYHRDFEYLLENICEIVLQNMIGHIMLDKPLQETGFSQEELESLEEILADKTEEQIKAYLLRALERLTAKYYDNDDVMLEYLSGGLSDIVTRIKYNTENHCLEQLFVF